jgi:hypothetical protein
VLSAASLQTYSGSQYLHKEFPHLKDSVALSKDYVAPFRSEVSPTDICRPLSPIGSDIDSFNFDWNKEDFDRDVIRMYLDA